ncbi:unnamed protein product [Pedinophyceae sp. YPF-701]|nr:unnamed protein product [Pedinophyceae sp. YPF-701]
MRITSLAQVSLALGLLLAAATGAFAQEWGRSDVMANRDAAARVMRLFWSACDTPEKCKRLCRRNRAEYALPSHPCAMFLDDADGEDPFPFPAGCPRMVGGADGMCPSLRCMVAPYWPTWHPCSRIVGEDGFAEGFDPVAFAARAEIDGDVRSTANAAVAGEVLQAWRRVADALGVDGSNGGARRLQQDGAGSLPGTPIDTTLPGLTSEQSERVIANVAQAIIANFIPVAFGGRGGILGLLGIGRSLDNGSGLFGQLGVREPTEEERANIELCGQPTCPDGYTPAPTPEGGAPTTPPAASRTPPRPFGGFFANLLSGGTAAGAESGEPSTAPIFSGGLLGLLTGTRPLVRPDSIPRFGGNAPGASSTGRRSLLQAEAVSSETKPAAGSAAPIDVIVLTPSVVSSETKPPVLDEDGLPVPPPDGEIREPLPMPRPMPILVAEDPVDPELKETEPADLPTKPPPIDDSDGEVILVLPTEETEPEVFVRRDPDELAVTTTAVEATSDGAGSGQAPLPGVLSEVEQNFDAAMNDGALPEPTPLATPLPPLGQRGGPFGFGILPFFQSRTPAATAPPDGSGGTPTDPPVAPRPFRDFFARLFDRFRGRLGGASVAATDEGDVVSASSSTVSGDVTRPVGGLFGLLGRAANGGGARMHRRLQNN